MATGYYGGHGDAAAVGRAEYGRWAGRKRLTAYAPGGNVGDCQWHYAGISHNQLGQEKLPSARRSPKDLLFQKSRLIQRQKPKTGWQNYSLLVLPGNPAMAFISAHFWFSVHTGSHCQNHLHPIIGVKKYQHSCTALLFVL